MSLYSNQKELKTIFFIIIIIWDMVSPWSPDWTQTHGLSSSSWARGLKTYIFGSDHCLISPPSSSSHHSTAISTRLTAMNSTKNKTACIFLCLGSFNLCSSDSSMFLKVKISSLWRLNRILVHMGTAHDLSVYMLRNP